MLSSASFALCLIMAGGANAETSHTSRCKRHNVTMCTDLALKNLYLYFLLACWLSPVQPGIPLFHDVRAGDLNKQHSCSHFSEIVSPSHGEVVAGKHFVLHVRCLAECGVIGAHVKIFLNEEFHPNPAVELECEERSATMKHIVITEPPSGLWTATIKTYRGSALLDAIPYSLNFIIIDPPAPLDASTKLRSTPWEEDSGHAHEVWGSTWGESLPHGYARCASDGRVTVERCFLHNCMASNGTFFIWPGTVMEQHKKAAQSSHFPANSGPLILQLPSKEGFSLYPCPAGQKSNCWGAASAVDVRYFMDDIERRASAVCDTVVMGTSVLFSLPYLGSTLSVYMAGLVSLVATVYDYESDLGLPLSHSTNTDILLISNAAPPAEAVLGAYLPLFSALTRRPVVSTTELSLQGNTCFDRLFVGTQHLLHLSPEHSADSDPDSAANRIDAAAKWWERVEGRLRGYASRTRNLVARALNLDATLGARFRGEWRVLIAVRYGWLNRDWFDVKRVIDAAQSVTGVRALSGRFSLTRSPQDDEDDWGPDWPPSGEETLLTLVRRLQNCSVLLGVTGEALASALWMPEGAMVIQILPYGTKGHYGREYAVLAAAGPGNYLEHELGGGAAHHYPWTPHPTAVTDSALYWKQDPKGAELMYMRVGGIEIPDADVVSLVSRAVKIVDARRGMQAMHAPAASEVAEGSDAGVGNGWNTWMSWHGAEGAVALLPPRGQYR